MDEETRNILISIIIITPIIYIGLGLYIDRKYKKHIDKKKKENDE